MAHSESVVGAFAHLGEAGQAAHLAVVDEGLAAAGEYLVRIGLMPHVPDNLVKRSVVDLVQGDGDLDRTEARPDMAGVLGATPYYILSEFFAQLLELLYREGLEVSRGVDMLEYVSQLSI